MRLVSFLGDALTDPGRLGTALRAAVALTACLVVGQLAGEAQLGIFAALGALSATLADVDAPYRERASAIGVGAAVVAAAVALGTAIAPLTWGALPAIALVAFLAGLLRALGPVGMRIGLVFALAFMLGFGFPAAGSLGIGARTAAVAIGAAGAFVLIAAVWPLRSRVPLRRALAGALRALAGYADDRSRGRSGARERARFRIAIERARDELEALGAAGRHLDDESGALYAAARSLSRVFSTTTALSEALRPERSTTELEQALLARTAAFARALEPLLEGEEASVAGPLADLDAAAATLADELRRETTPARVLARPALTVLSRHAHGLADSLLLAARSEERVALPFRPRRGLAEAAGEIGAVLARALHPGSSEFRHALRVGLAASGAYAAALALEAERAYWAPLTAILILQPGLQATLRRGSDRFIGTLAGAVVGVLVVTALGRTPTLALVDLLAFLVTVGVFLSFGIRPRLASFFATVLVLLLVEILLPSTWVLAGWRVVDTLIGVVVASLVAFVVLPEPERSRVQGRLADSVRALRRELELCRRLHEGEERWHDFQRERRELGTRLGDAVDALDELPARDAPLAEPARAFLDAARRFGDGVNALALYAGQRGADEDFLAYAPELVASLRLLERSLAEAREPASESAPLLEGETTLGPLFAALGEMQEQAAALAEALEQDRLSWLAV